MAILDNAKFLIGDGSSQFLEGYLVWVGGFVHGFLDSV